MTKSWWPASRRRTPAQIPPGPAPMIATRRARPDALRLASSVIRSVCRASPTCDRAALHRFERQSRTVGEMRDDAIARRHRSVGEDDPHDSGFARERAVGVAVEHRGHQAGDETVELRAWIAQAGDLDDGVVAEVESGSGREAEQVDATRGHVLTHRARAHDELACRQLVVELAVDQVHLPAVGLAGIACDSRSVLD